MAGRDGRATGFPAHAGMDPSRSPRSRSPRGLPRTRGDGPRSAPRSTAGTAASPHTRGWTQVAVAPGRVHHGFPAHAGMDPGARRRATTPSGLPRTRGDGPYDPERAIDWDLASPHTRGWTLARRRSAAIRAGFPAHAGMDPQDRQGGAFAAGLPRTRGDGPTVILGPAVMAAASPHTRGWTDLPPMPHRGRSGFPAHAGMDPTAAAGTRGGARLPRTRGDGPAAGTVAAEATSASPHTRGWTLRPVPAAARGGGFPAHAGMDPAACGRRRRRPGLPRTRGDGPTRTGAGTARTVASPHTRGWTLGRADQRSVHRGFPAHAGMDPGRPRPGRAGRRLPRTRGDGPELEGVAHGEHLASPHTRGWPRRQGHCAPQRSGFPAHAGMDLPRAATAMRRSWLPRTRGDGPLGGRGLAEFVAASPHTRGWTPEVVARARRDRGFPAHAGMDPASHPGAGCRGGLPRTRGDGPYWTPPGCRCSSASPHTRGWTRHRDRAADRAAGFPAHAGMDPARAPPTPATGRLPRTRGDGPRERLRRRREAAASPHTRGWTLEMATEKGTPVAT